MKTALEFDIEVSIGEHIKTIYVEPCLAGVLQCNNCRKYGHKSCKSTTLCPKCGEAHNDNLECTRDPICINCGEGHSVYYRKCKIYREEKYYRISKILIDLGIKYKKGKKLEARQTTSQLAQTKDSFSNAACYY